MNWKGGVSPDLRRLRGMGMTLEAMGTQVQTQTSLLHPFFWSWHCQNQGCVWLEEGAASLH